MRVNVCRNAGYSLELGKHNTNPKKRLKFKWTRVPKLGTSIDVKDVSAATVRAKLGLSVGSFAKLLGVSHRTVEKWDKGTKPNTAAQILLRIAQHHPEIVQDAVMES